MNNVQGESGSTDKSSPRFVLVHEHGNPIIFGEPRRLGEREKG